MIGKRSVIEVGGTRCRLKNRDQWYVIPDHHQPIVDKETFQLAQDTICRYTAPVKRNREYPLKGKVVCGCCGHALTRTTNKTPYYLCRYSQASESLFFTRSLKLASRCSTEGRDALRTFFPAYS